MRKPADSVRRSRGRCERTRFLNPRELSSSSGFRDGSSAASSGWRARGLPARSGRAGPLSRRPAAAVESHKFQARACVPPTPPTSTRPGNYRGPSLGRGCPPAEFSSWFENPAERRRNIEANLVTEPVAHRPFSLHQLRGLSVRDKLGLPARQASPVRRANSPAGRERLREVGKRRLARRALQERRHVQSREPAPSGQNFATKLIPPSISLSPMPRAAYPAEARSA